MKSSYKLMIVAAAGLIAGAVLGMLFAPAKGTDLRMKMKDQGNRMKDGLHDMIGKAEEQLRETRGKSPIMESEVVI